MVDILSILSQLDCNGSTRIYFSVFRTNAYYKIHFLAEPDYYVSC